MNTTQVLVTAMSHGGDAVARHQGKVIFVPYALPGEQILVEVTEEKASYARGRLVEVINPSPKRVEPRCPHFATCGGCHWQHIAYDAQLGLREKILAAQLRRIGQLTDAPVKPTLGSADPWHYRNHVQLHLHQSGHLGFMAAREHSVVVIRECPIMHPLVADVFAALDVDFPELKMASIRAGTITGEQLLVLETSGESAPAVEIDLPVSCVLLLEDGTPITYVGNAHITEKIAGRPFRISAASFFQVNTAQAELLVQKVAQYLEPQGDEALLDLYCGVGTIGLTLAEKLRSVVGIEQSPAAAGDARFNSRDVANFQLLEGPAEEIVPGLEQRIDIAVLDPPRRGCHAKVLATLLTMAPRKIAYVSCDPATLARDLGRLIQGGYELVDIQPIDMFPQTCHVEAVALLLLPT